MSFPTAYTPLESLLLFQALRFEGVNSHVVFNRISEQLKRVRLVQNDPTYDSGRLSPDALRELYLGLLKEEVKEDLQRESDRDSILHNGSVSPGSRKRKAPSPSLPTVHEASQYAHLIPQLVTRLYARYREHTVRDIREHERQCTALTREIREIEAGEWDERLRKQRTASKTQSPRPPTSTLPPSTSTKHSITQTVKSTNGSPSSPRMTGESNVQPPKPYKSSKIGDVINHGPEPEYEASLHRRNSSNTTLPPLSEMAPQSPRFGIPPKVPLATQVSSHGFSRSPPSDHQSPYGPHHGHPASVPIASPQVQHSLSRPSSSPRPILPPPPGMKLPPPSPGQLTASPNLRGPPLTHQHHYSPQPPSHRLSTGQSPTHELPRGYPQSAPHQMAATPGYYQQQPYVDRRTSYQAPQHQLHPGFPSQTAHMGGYQLPPFSVDPQQNQQMLPQYVRSSVPQQPPVHGQRPSHQRYAPSSPSSSQRQPPPNSSRLVSDIIAALATPKAPGWKRASTLSVGTPMPSPQPEPLSPVMKRSEPTARPTRPARNRDAVPTESSAEPEMLLKPATRGRGRPKRDRSPHSVVSSTADESGHVIRSQSVSTAAGAMPTSDDQPGSKSNVKAEPLTPAGFVEVPDVAHDVSSTGRPMTRKRRGTLQTQPQPILKRRRQQSPGHASEDVGTPPPRSNRVVATRNFNKVSQTIMNDITSHKHGGLFGNPVRDKDAPGYSEIIKQPQNLKSIRMATNAGAKAVQAATAALEPPDAAATSAASTSKAVTGDSTTVELERTADLIPPKAIVNGAQLEKEIMRMFANAVMFNPGEDGMVSDTREMFEDVEVKLAQWRGAEKEVGETEGEEEVKGKRRKL